MTKLPQPPSDVPAPPVSETAILSRRKWGWLKVVGIASILALLFFEMTPPMVIPVRKKADQTEAVNNARQIGLALFEFEMEYGRFPDSTTIDRVRADSATELDLGTRSSNQFFRQLLASGVAQSEAMFYAKVDGSRKPDAVLGKGEAVKKGECGFAYLANLDAAGNPDRPLVVVPLIPGTDRFDPERFDGKAVILKVDNSVVSMKIDPSGHVMLDGRNILDPHHPVWDGHAPTIAWPDL